MTLIEAAYMALEYGSFPQGGGIVREIRKAIEEAERQEPAAWKDKTYGNLHHQDFGDSIPLYTAPPKREWQGLTEKEHTDIAIQCGCMSADWVFYGATVERVLKEKNS